MASSVKDMQIYMPKKDNAVDGSNFSGQGSSNDIQERVEKGQASTGRGNKSPALQHFTKIGLKEYSCDLCRARNPTRQIVVKRNKHGSTNIFWRHLKKIHIKVHNELKGINTRQISVTDMIQTATPKKECYTTVRYEQMNEEIVRFICTTDSPWDITDKKGFVRLLRYCAQSDIEIPGSEVVKEAAKKVYEEMKVKLQRKFQKVSSVSLTVGTWTTENNIALLSVTMYWIDDDWTLHERVLVIGDLVGKHSEESMAEILMTTLDDFGLQSKVCAVTAEDTPNTKKMMNVLATRLKDLNPRFTEERFVPCLAHFITLVVQEGLKELHIPLPPPKPANEEDNDAGENRELSHDVTDAASQHNLSTLGKAIGRVRDLVAGVRETKQWFEKYQDLCNIYKLPDSNKLPLDCRTSWKSTYAMLVSAHAKREALNKMAMCFLNTPTKSYGVTAEEWDIIKVFVEVIEPLRDASNYLIRSKSNSASMAIFVVSGLLQHIDAMIGMIQTNGFYTAGRLVPMAAEERNSLYLACLGMKSKFTNYMDVLTCNQAFSIGIVLDPTAKLRDINPHHHDGVLSYIRSLLVDLGNAEDLGDVPNTSVVEGSPITSQPNTSFFSRLLATRLPPREHKPQPAPNGELEKYLMTPSNADDAEPLGWWRREGQWTYPNLAHIAKQFLSICPTSAPSKQLLSSYNEIATYKRTKLNTGNSGMLLTLKCWVQYDDSELDQKDAELTIDGCW